MSGEVEVCGWLARQGGQRGVRDTGSVCVCEQQEREEGLKVEREVLVSTQ